MISCTKNYKFNNCSINFSVSIGNNLAIDKTEVESAVSSVFNYRQADNNSVEIVIYGNSSGKEIFSYSGDEQKEIQLKTQPGRIEALIKVKIDNQLKDVFFIEASGNSREEILKQLAVKLRQTLCN